MFSQPLPEFSCRLNALATAVTCQWLMGPCKVNDIELDDGSVSAENRYHVADNNLIEALNQHGVQHMLHPTLCTAQSAVIPFHILC